MTANNLDEQEQFDSVYQSLAAIIKREKESAESYRKQVLEQDPMDLSDDFTRGNLKLDDEQQLKKSLQKLEMTVEWLTDSDVGLVQCSDCRVIGSSLRTSSRLRQSTSDCWSSSRRSTCCKSKWAWTIVTSS